MDKQLARIIDDNTPKFNSVIVDGLAVEQMPFAREYIDRIWRCAETGFPEGLVYIRSERCTPQEEFNEITRRNGKGTRYELAASDIFMMKYLFEYNGEPLKPAYMFLPYVRDAGLLKLRGSLLSVSPVLANKIIDVQENSIFVPLNGAKLTFERKTHYFKLDGKQHDASVVWSEIYNLSSKAKRVRGKPTMTMHHAMVHYLLCRYGLTRTFAEFGKAEVHCGHGEPNRQRFPETEWHICQSKGFKPHGIRGRLYTPTSFWLAIPKSQFNRLTAGMIAGLFYVVDHFPDLIDALDVDETHMWKIALGHAIFASNASVGKLVEDIEAHLTSLDTYIDEMAVEEFQREGLSINNIYELFLYMIEMLPELVMRPSSDSASMFGKRLSVLRFVLFDTTKAIFNFKFKLKANNKKQLTAKDIERVMSSTLKLERVFDISNGHGEVVSVTYPGDNKFLKITSNVALQNDNVGKGGAKKANLTDVSKILHASIAVVNQYSNLPKSNPTGRNRISPFLQITADGEVMENPLYSHIIEETQNKIRR